MKKMNTSQTRVKLKKIQCEVVILNVRDVTLMCLPHTHRLNLAALYVFKRFFRPVYVLEG